MASADIVFLQDLAVVLVVAAVTAVLSHKARQPVVLGYLLAGIIVGPHTPPFSLVQDQSTIETLGQVGVVFLLFGLGLHFDLKRLRAVGTTAVISGTLQILLMIWIGFMVGQAFGLSPVDSIFLGAIISISSTVIIVKIVSEFGQQEQKWAQIAFGILIIEDILAVCILTVLSGTGGSAPPSIESLGRTLGFIGIFIASALVIGLLAVPRIIAAAAKFPQDEVLLITALGLASGLALFGTLLGFSPALGAFIMGALIAESKDRKKVERLTAPVRDMFSAIFFVSVGMLFNPALLLTHWALILAVTAAVVGGKVAAVSFAVFITGHEPKTALRAGFSLAQVGEFSFIIAALGLTLGVTIAPLYEVAVAVAAITAFTTPILIRSSPRVAEMAAARAPRSLVTFARLYHTWIARLRGPAGTGAARAQLGRQAFRSALFGAVLTEIVILGSGALPLLTGAIAAALPALEWAASGIGWALVLLVALPFAYLFFAALRAMADVLAKASTPHSAGGAESRRLVRAVLRSAFTLAGLIGIGAALLSVASPFVPTLPLVLLVGSALLGASFVLFRSMSRFQERVDEVLTRALGGQAEAAEALDDGGVLRTIQEKYPWGIEERVVPLTRASWGAGRSIARSRVRSLTGATILDIERGEHKILNPPPEELLEEGDRVVLVGEPAHLAAAEALLQKGPGDAEIPEGPPMVGEIRIGPGSPFIGSSLAATHLHERTGVTVLAVVRAGRELKDPSADLHLEVTDVLVVLGTPPQVERARDAAAPPGTDRGALPPEAAGPPAAPS